MNRRVLLWVLVLVACGHGQERVRGGDWDPSAPEEGVRSKGGVSAAARINALIARGEYAEAEALIDLYVSSGLLEKAMSDELREKVKQTQERKEPEKKRDEDTKRPPTFVEPVTCKKRFPNHPVCNKLPEEYEYSSEHQALRAMKARLRQPSLSLHGEEDAESGPCRDTGTHFNVRLNGKREGSIACCLCCVQAQPEPVEWTKCRIVW